MPTGAFTLATALVRQCEVRSNSSAVKNEAEQRQCHHSEDRIPVQVPLFCSRFSFHTRSPSSLVLWGGLSFLFLSGVDKSRMRRQRALPLTVQAPRHCSVAVEITSSWLTEVCALDLRERRTNGMRQTKRFESASCKGTYELRLNPFAYCWDVQFL